MSKQHPKIPSYTAQALDVLTLIVAFFLSFPLWHFLIQWAPYSSRVEARDFAEILFPALFMWWLLLKWQETYGPQHLVSFKALVSKILRTAVIGTLSLLGFVYLAKWTQVPRTLILTFSLLGFLGLVLEKLVWLKFLRHLRRKDRGYNHILIVGATEIARRFVASVNQFVDWRVRILGFLVKENNPAVSSFCGAPALGTFRDLAGVLHGHPVDEVIFAIPTKDFEDVREMMDICEVEGVKTRIISDFFSGLVFKAEADVIHGIPIITYSPAPRKEGQLLVKRVLDIGFSFTALVLLSPLFAVVAVAIKLTSPGPVFYSWKVVGLNKRPFAGYKFRTMVVNADKMKEMLLDKNEMNGPVFKLRQDPRVTRVGRFLRKYSLDELPQLWSVLKGDMSLVGPHPPLETELCGFQDWHWRKLSVKPGVTCLWQVSGRNEIREFDDWVKMDLDYIDNWSLSLDLKILLKTIPAVLSAKGAS